MITKLRRVSSHRVTRNTAALFILQIINMVAPLMVLPYLSRVLGVEAFGLVMLALSIIAIGVIVTDYGFNLSATYTIAKHRSNIAYVSELIGAVFLIKALLALVFLIIVMVFGYFMGYSDCLLPLLIGFNVLLQAFLPAWFFQGIERMKEITIYMVCAKLAYVVMVYVSIDQFSQVSYVILLLCLSNIFASLVAIRFIYLNGYSIVKPSKKIIIEILRYGAPFFVSRAAVSVYTTASTFLVGAYGGLQQAAYYGASEKLYQASQSVTGPVAQALFPYMAEKQDDKLFFKVVLFIGFPLVIGCLLVGIWADQIVRLIFGPGFSESGPILQVFLIVTIINFIGVNFGYPAFASVNRVNIANYTVLLGAVIQVCCLSFLFFTGSFSAISVALSVLVTEVFVMLLRVFIFLYIKRKSHV